MDGFLYLFSLDDFFDVLLFFFPFDFLFGFVFFGFGLVDGVDDEG